MLYLCCCLPQWGCQWACVWLCVLPCRGCYAAWLHVGSAMCSRPLTFAYQAVIVYVGDSQTCTPFVLYACFHQQPCGIVNAAGAWKGGWVMAVALQTPTSLSPHGHHFLAPPLAPSTPFPFASPLVLHPSPCHLLLLPCPASSPIPTPPLHPSVPSSPHHPFHRHQMYSQTIAWNPKCNDLLVVYVKTYFAFCRNSQTYLLGTFELLWDSLMQPHTLRLYSTNY